MLIDFHSHIIPGIDDGAKTVEESLNMLKSSYEKGVRMTVLTSHYYPKGQESLDTFLEKREKAFLQLKEAYEKETEPMPELRLGCEVNISTDLADYEGIEKLCIEGTNYIMLEMPHNWDETLYDRIYNIKLKGLRPIMAHIDRYLPVPKKILGDIRELGVLYQVNADAFLHFGIKREIAKLFKEGCVHILGSDMHNLDERDNNLDKAMEILKNQFGEEYIRYLTENSEAIVNNKKAHLRWHKYLPDVGMMDLIFNKKKSKE